MSMTSYIDNMSLFVSQKFRTNSRIMFLHIGP